MCRGRNVVGILALVIAACAEHVPEPRPHPDLPHISWTIGLGNQDEDVCQSTTLGPCTIERNRNGKPQIATFHLFLHPATTETKYEGTTDIGFIEGAGDPKAQKTIETTVKPGSRAVNVSTTGLMRPAGSYEVVITLSATPTGGAAIPIRLQVPVIVK